MTDRAAREDATVRTVAEVLRFPFATPRRAAVMLPLLLAWPYMVAALPDVIHGLWGRP